MKWDTSIPWARFALGIALLFTFHSAHVDGATSESPSPQWIWGAAKRNSEQAFCVRREFSVEGRIDHALLTVVADFARAAIFLNGRRVATQEPYGKVVRLDVTEQLHSGENAIGLCVRSVDGPAAVMARLELELAGGGKQTIVSDTDWLAASIDAKTQLRWPSPEELKKPNWRPAVSFGNVILRFWRLEEDTIAISPVDDYTQWKRAIDAKAGTDPETFQVPSGFKVQLLRSAAEGEDSWVSLVCDPHGRWIIGMEKRGLLRLTLPAAGGGDVRVERINDSLRECRGLVFAHDSLYAMANSDKALFRLRDTNNDDQFDTIEKLADFPGDSGHGRNQLTLGPKGNVHGIFGDSVFEPNGAEKLPPELADPTRAEKTRSAFIARFNEDASEITVLVRGLRNPFGLDFNEHGEMFTYDADAEYDMGSSWYRPTRVNHVLPGGDYRWRRVTRQWPPYFIDQADMPQPLLDIGKGSPTAVEFAYKSNFPPRYRRALFALDWAYGRILAVHLTPRGASYQACAETFLRGRPLNVTDVEFGPDGAMYFVTGGRGTQSAMYRVEYVGEEKDPLQFTAQQSARRQHAEKSRALRRRLQTLIDAPKGDSEAIDFVWPNLHNSDPWIRHAARTVVESRPVDAWRQRALSDDQLDAWLAASMALVRVGAKPPYANIVEKLRRMDLAQRTKRQQLEAMFLYERSLLNADRLDSSHRSRIFAQLQSLYPSDTWEVNRHVSRLLAENPDERFVPTTLKLLQHAATQNERLHCLFVLRHVQRGWTPDLRRRYFEHLRRMDDFVGGEGLPTFRKLIRQEALAAVPEAERKTCQAMLGPKSVPAWQGEITESKTEHVRKWTVEELEGKLDALRDGRDLERGREMFAAARCIQCHRCGGPGGVSGPDLTSVAQRFSPRDMLVSMIEPSQVISEKYAADTFELKDGRIVSGRIAPGDYRSPTLSVVPNLLEPEKVITIAKSDIDARHVSPISPMPTGLLNVLTKDEILDLLAFMLSAK